MNKAFKVLSISMMSLFSFSLFAHASEFSADMITNAGGESIQSKISVKGQKSRIEMPQATMINRGDLGVAWMLMPTENMYMEHPLDAKTLAQTSTEAQGQMQREPLGKDTIDGKSYDKFKVTYRTKNSTDSMLQWIGPNNIPVKVAALDESWSVEYRNIQTSGVDDAIFEIPQGLQKMQMPSMESFKHVSADKGE